MANATERAIRRKRKTAAGGGGKPLAHQFKKRPKVNSSKSGSDSRKRYSVTGNRRSAVPQGGDGGREKKVLKEKGDEVGVKENGGGEVKDEYHLLSTLPASQQLQFFLSKYQSATGITFSPLELDEFKETCMVELPRDVKQEVEELCNHVKDNFMQSWKEVLCEGKVIEGKVEPGSPAVLIVSGSALRSLELLRGLKKLTRECQPAKLFAKHIKLEDQVSLLKKRVNIASGTPSRINKLIDVDALGLSRLSMVVIDMHRDAKGYSLLNLPQVSKEFWDLYTSHFHQRLLQSELRICFYGLTSVLEFQKAIQSHE